MSTELDIDFVFIGEDADALIGVLDEAGARDVEELVEQDFLPGVEIVVVAIIGVSALINVVGKLQRMWRRGLIIDCRGSRIRTERSEDLPRGSVLVITKEGNQHVLHEPKELEIGALLEKFA